MRVNTALKRKLFGFLHTTILRILVLEIHRVCVSSVFDVSASAGFAFGFPIASRRSVCFYSLFSNMIFCASSHVSFIRQLRVFEYSFHLSLQLRVISARCFHDARLSQLSCKFHFRM